MSPPVDIVSLSESSMCRNAFPTFFLVNKLVEEGGGKKEFKMSSRYNIPWLCAICQCPMFAFPLMKGRGNRTISPAAYTPSVAFMCYKLYGTDGG